MGAEFSRIYGKLGFTVLEELFLFLSSLISLNLQRLHTMCALTPLLPVRFARVWNYITFGILFLIQYTIGNALPTGQASLLLRLSASGCVILLQWNLVITRSDITKSSYNEVILLVPALYIP